MAFEGEQNKENSNESIIDFKKEYKDLQREVRSKITVQKETSEQYEPLKVYEVKNISDVGFGKSSKCSTNKDELHFAVNGPLVGNDGKPVGGYIDGGNKVKDFVEPSTGGGNFAVDNGVFGLGKDGKLHLVPYKELGNSSVQFKWAFQNGPMLIQNNKNLRENGTSTSKYNRSGIGFTPAGRAMVIYSDEPVTLKEFAEVFVDRGCNNAIYLDGGPYAGYEDPSGSYGKLNATAEKLQFFHQN